MRAIALLALGVLGCSAPYRPADPFQPVPFTLRHDPTTPLRFGGFKQADATDYALLHAEAIAPIAGGERHRTLHVRLKPLPVKPGAYGVAVGATLRYEEASYRKDVQLEGSPVPIDQASWEGALGYVIVKSLAPLRVEVNATMVPDALPENQAKQAFTLDLAPER